MLRLGLEVGVGLGVDLGIKRSLHVSWLLPVTCPTISRLIDSHGNIYKAPLPENG